MLSGPKWAVLRGGVARCQGFKGLCSVNREQHRREPLAGGRQGHSPLATRWLPSSGIKASAHERCPAPHQIRHRTPAFPATQPFSLRIWGQGLAK